MGYNIVMTKEEEISYVRSNKRIDGHLFNNVKDITRAIDLHNEMKKKNLEDRFEEDTQYFTKTALDSMFKKYFLLKRS